SVHRLASARTGALTHDASHATARSVYSNAARNRDVLRHASARHVAAPLRWSSSKATPLGLKDGANDLGISPTMKMIAGYITVSMTAMVVIARYKDRDEVEEENARVFNMAKRAVVKDRRFFEAIGYPKEFEQIKSEGEDVDQQQQLNSFTEGSFRVVGDKGTAIVTYKQGLLSASNEEDSDAQDSSLVTFDVLHVRLEDGSEFSALDSYLKNESVATQQKSQSLGKKLFVPVIGGVIIGGISSFFVIRILRNRPFYVHKLVLDHVNNNEIARTLLGHPIKSNRKDYVGTLTNDTANYTISCRGPKGDGTLIVKAFKNEKDAGREENETGPLEIMTTPGTAWKFSTLVLSVKRNGSQRAKNSKTINLLAGGNSTPTN
uniref:Uncharacterized protein n=1 Tax=Globisporangium ultimum (strain ATCC 200006 / CBS 805.95 / DAOM BR144) TaxID=431595 RepID=K3WS88_GLOUD